MKLLWFSHFVPYPPQGGAHQRSFNLIRQLSRWYEISLVAFNRPRARETKERLAEHERELRKYCERVEFWEMPVEWRGARWWVGLGMSPVLRGPFACRAFWSRQLATRWQEILREHQGALLHVDSPDLALFTAAAKGFRKLLNHHNCESAMTYRRAQKEPNLLKKFYLQIQARKLDQLEEEICHYFEVNAVVSQTDAQLLRARNPRAHIHVIENGTDVSYFRPGDVEVEPKSAVFASSMNWYPNLSAIRFFERKIWPLLKQRCPGVRLYLAGQFAPRWLVQWAERQPDVTLVADPPDIRPWISRAAVFICPIVDGGGTRLKILDALAMGKAVVSTRIGCEGLRVEPGKNILVADAPGDFACAVARLLEDVSLRCRLGIAGRSLVEEEYSWERIAGHLKQAYGCAQQGGACKPQPEGPAEVRARR